MQHPKWFVLISVLGLIGVAVGWLTASEEMNPGTAPTLAEAAAMPTAVPSGNQLLTQPDTHASAALAGDRIQTQPDALPAPVVSPTQPIPPPPVPEPHQTPLQSETPAQAGSPQPAAQSAGFQTAAPSPGWASESAPAQSETPTQAASPRPVPAPADQSAGFQTAAPSPGWASEPATARIDAPEQPASPEPIPGPPPAGLSAQPGAATAYPGSGFGPSATRPQDTSSSPSAVPELEQAMPGPPRTEPTFHEQTPVDTRRAQARRQREAIPGGYGAPHRYMPPWFAGYGDSLERYRDARRDHYSKQRDLRRQRRESRLDAMCPWPKPQREWSAQRNDRRQIERLERRANRNGFMNRPPYGFGGPGGW